MSVRVFRFADPAVVYVGVAFVAAGVAGCRLVPLDLGAEGVRVIDKAEATSCEELGNTRVKVLGNVGPARRGASRVEEELSTLARNAGAELNGNAVMAMGPVEDGTRGYRILRCPTAP
jgi:hypothetical protein